MTVSLKFPKGSTFAEASADDPAELLWVLHLMGVHPAALTKEEYQVRLADFASWIYGEVPVRNDADDQSDGAAP